tara:strand:+ start:179 stop:406 length:228 start_codon:yes stop_codon:yes gene_type:complete
MINIVNNSRQTVYIFHLYDGNVLQIGLIEPNKSLLRDLKKGNKIQINSILRYKNITVPWDIIDIKTIGENNFILI